MKILVVGAESQIGCAFVDLLKNLAIAFESMRFEDALLVKVADLEKRVREQKITFIVNVDHIEGFHTEGHTQRDLERRHVYLPQQLAKVAEACEISLLQISDYHVFSGSRDKPYSEDDEPHAQSLYGVTRWQGELSVQRSTHRYIVLRVGTIFCEQGRNVLTTLLDQWKCGEALELSTLLQFSPTPTSDVARVIYAILQQLECDAQLSGIYHYCGADVATPYDFAEVLLSARKQFTEDGIEIKIQPIQGFVPKVKHKSRITQTTAINNVLTCKKILNTFGIRQRTWRGELTNIILKISQEKKI